VRIPGSGLFAGVDVGGTKIGVVISDAHAKIVAEGVIPTEPQAGPAQAVERTNRLLDDLCREHSVEILAIGVGLPGLVDHEAGTMIFLPSLPEQWRGFGISAAFASFSQRPVFLLNDARMATLGEFTFGKGGGSQDMRFVIVGTGIGGGLVPDGKLRLGAFGAAGELGHHTIVPEGPVWGCGNRGCLEALVSGPSLAAAGRAPMREARGPRLRELVGGDPAKVTATRMADAAAEGDDTIADAIRVAADYLGLGIANAVTITAVPNVNIGGGLSILRDLLVEPVRQQIRRRVRMFPADVVQVSCSSLGEKCGGLGGVALAVQGYSRTTLSVST